MKKVLAICVCVVWLAFGGCDDETFISCGTRVTLAEAPPAAAEFITALCEQDVQELRRFTQCEEAATRLATVKVTEYALEAATATRPFTVLLKVAKSDLPTIPVGCSEWGLYTGVSEFSTIRWGAADEMAAWIDGVMVQEDAVAFAYVMATSLSLFDTVADTAVLLPAWVVAQSENLVLAHGQLARRRGDEMVSEFSEAEMTALCAEMLGVSVTDFSAAPTYANGKVVLWGRGSAWYSCALQEYTQEGDTHTVTLRFYADATALCEAVTARYTLKETAGGFRLVAVETISRTDMVPLVLYM